MNSAQSIDVAQVIERQTLNKNLVWLVVLSWTITFFDGYDMNIIGFAAPALSAELKLSKIAMGQVFSVGLFGAMVGGFLFGWLGDRYGRRPAIIAATFGFGFLTIANGFAHDFTSLVALRFALGVMTGGMLPLCWALNIEYAPKHYRATVVTMVMIGYSAGIAAGGPIALWLIPAYGWPSVFYFGGVLSLMAGAVLVWKLPESLRFLVAKDRAPSEIAANLKRFVPDFVLPANPRFVAADEEGHSREFRPRLLFAGALRWITPILWFGYVFSSVTAFFLATWTPLVLEALQFSRTEAATVASINSLAGVVGAMALMRFTDRLGVIALAAMPLMAIPLLLAAAFLDLGHTGFLVAFGLIAFALLGGHFGMHSIAGMFYPSAYRGSGAGWATSVAKIGSIAGPMVGGYILSTALPVRHIFGLLALCPAVLFVCVTAMAVLHKRSLAAAAAGLSPVPVSGPQLVRS